MSEPIRPATPTPFAPRAGVPSRRPLNQSSLDSASANRRGDLSLKPPMAKVAARKTALGLVCTQSFPAVVGAADAMLKSAGIVLVGYEKTGDGYCTAVVRGNYADVKLAIEIGAETAKTFEQYVSSMMLPRPLPNLDTVLPITEEFAEYVERAGGFEATGAIGLIETTGFPAMVGASDAAMKCANVELITYETTGAGLCTAVIQGPIADVTMAVEAGMQEAERIGDMHAIMVIARPLDDLMKVMPKPKHWVVETEEPQALELPELETMPEQQPLVLPEPERVPIPVEIPRVQEQQAMELREPLELNESASPELSSRRLELESSDEKAVEFSPRPLAEDEVLMESEPKPSSLPLPQGEPLRLESAKIEPDDEPQA